MKKALEIVRVKMAMMAKYVAGQLTAPSGVVGRWILAPLWNRRNSALNDFAFGSLALQPCDRVLEVRIWRRIPVRQDRCCGDPGMHSRR